MVGVNKVIIIGRLGRDPELSTHGEGTTRAVFSVATAERWTDKEGERQERTEWHKVVAWGKTAQLVGQYLVKGSRVCVQGKLQTRRWQDAAGQSRLKTEIVADQVTFLDSRRSQDAA